MWMTGPEMQFRLTCCKESYHGHDAVHDAVYLLGPLPVFLAPLLPRIHRQGVSLPLLRLTLYTQGRPKDQYAITPCNTTSLPH